MAGLSFHGGVWVAKWYIGKRQKTRRFPDRESGLRWLEEAGLPYRPRGKSPRNETEMAALIASRCEVSEDGCWLWTGPLATDGYARLTWRRGGAVISGAHRIVLHTVGRPVPSDLVVDHLCRVRHCVNPDHLDIVTSKENVMRSPITQAAINAAKTHCPHGHPYSPENTYIYTRKTRKTTTRICKTCQHNHYLRRRAERMGVAS